MALFKVLCVCALALHVFGVVCDGFRVANRIEGRSYRVRRDVNKIETINGAVDVALREIREIMKKNDPLRPPNQTDSALLVTLAMNNIKVYNTSTIKRASDVIVLDDEEARLLTAQVALTFDDLQVRSDYKLSALVIASVGQIFAKVPEVVVDFTLQVDYNKLEITMSKFKLTKNDSRMEIKFSGNIESLVLNVVLSLATGILGNLILVILQDPIKKQINNALDKINKAIQEMMLTPA